MEEMSSQHPLLVTFFALTLSASAANLTGNWVVAQDMHDGTFRRIYLDLKQDGSQITGHIRATQFYYTVSQSSHAGRQNRTQSPL
jgi:hypothetical protein